MAVGALRCVMHGMGARSGRGGREARDPFEHWLRWREEIWEIGYSRKDLQGEGSCGGSLNVKAWFGCLWGGRMCLSRGKVFFFSIEWFFYRALQSERS